MNFNDKTLETDNVEHYVWQRDTGDLVVVVIDDQCGLARANSDEVNILHEAILPLLREHACSWEETKAIGFFRLMAMPDDADKLLKLIQDWLNEITDFSSKIRFLVDALYGRGVYLGTKRIITQLTDPDPDSDLVSYPKEDIAYLTKGTIATISNQLPRGYKIFLKGNEAKSAQDDEKLSPKLMSFLVR